VDTGADSVDGLGCISPDIETDSVGKMESTTVDTGADSMGEMEGTTADVRAGYTGETECIAFYFGAESTCAMGSISMKTGAASATDMEATAGDMEATAGDVSAELLDRLDTGSTGTPGSKQTTGLQYVLYIHENKLALLIHWYANSIFGFQRIFYLCFLL
jgi:hypothetical protein